MATPQLMRRSFARAADTQKRNRSYDGTERPRRSIPSVVLTESQLKRKYCSPQPHLDARYRNEIAFTPTDGPNFISRAFRPLALL